MSRYREHPPDHYDEFGRHLPPEDFPPSKRAPGDLEALRQFINTVNKENGVDRLSDPAALGRWLLVRGVPTGGVTGPQWRAALRLREGLREWIEANHDPETGDAAAAMAAVDELARKAHLVVRLTGDGPRLQPVDDGVDGYLAWLIGVAYTADRDGIWVRLKACRNHGCRWAFYDHSKNQSGSWCAMKACGDRLKARSYRRRRTQGELAT